MTFLVMVILAVLALSALHVLTGRRSRVLGGTLRVTGRALQRRDERVRMARAVEKAAARR